MYPRLLPLSILVSALLLFSPVASAQVADPVPDWPEHYDPFTVLTYQLELRAQDWDTIRRDLSFDIEVPALFSANAEAPVLVSVRRKSATAFPNEDDPQKVALKIDINEYATEDAAGEVVCDDAHGFVAPVCVEKWHDMKKLSLESGDDNNVVTEGISWYLHRLASETFDYTPGFAAWVEVYITLTNGTDGNGDPVPTETFFNGVFVNVEQHDKQFLKNHGLWAGGDDTWLTKFSDVYSPKIKEAPEDVSGAALESPFVRSLNFRPFQKCGRGKGSGGCDSQPMGAAFVSALDHYINIEGMLTFAAVSAVHLSPDDLFSKGKNFFQVDYSDVSIGRREYLQWDLDSAFSGFDASADIYAQGRGKFGDYEDWIIDEPALRDRYSEVMRGLLDGPFNSTDLSTALTAFESVLAPGLAADPHSNLPDGGSGEFANLRSWLTERFDNVEAQLSGSPPPAPGEPLHVGGLSGTSATARRNRWDATATIEIHDAMHAGVDGATVSGAWSTGGSGTCVTVAGACDITRANLRYRVSTTTFSVQNIELAGASYEPAANDLTPAVVISRP
jgi:hypothetical protein